MTDFGRLSFMQPVQRLLKSEGGPAAVEYAVMLMLIIAVCAVAIQVIANWLYGSVTNSASEIQDCLT